MEIIQLSPTHVNHATDVLTRAFHDDPMYVYILPDPDERLRAVPAMWKALLNFTLRFGDAYTTPDVAGVALWLKPGDPGVTIKRLMQTRFAIPRSVIGFSAEARRRMMEMVGMTEKAHKRLMPMPHWYLWALGVDPAYQGKGIGSALIDPVLQRASEAGLPCYLETDTESNVRFYEKRGFRVLETHDAGFRVLLMRRD